MVTSDMVVESAVVTTSPGGSVVMLGVAAVGGEPWKLNIALEAIYSRNNGHLNVSTLPLYQEWNHGSTSCGHTNSSNGI